MWAWLIAAACVIPFIVVLSLAHAAARGDRINQKGRDEK